MEIFQLESKYRKQIKFNYSKQNFIFDVNPTLFSSAHLDKGTFQLIDSLRKDDRINFEKILDIGCGYGPIGIILKKLYPNSEVVCSDRDVMAVDYTIHNSKLNNTQIKTIASLDYENLHQTFSLICSNYPAKVGINAMRKFVYGASKYLIKEGILAIVIVRELEEDFKKIKREEINILYESKSQGHIVYHISFNKIIDFDTEKISPVHSDFRGVQKSSHASEFSSRIFDKDVYKRKDIEFKLDNKTYFLKTAYNIDEFESPSYATGAIIRLIKDLKINQIAILDPLQGHLPIAVQHFTNPSEMTIISRDLLSLKFTKENLETNNIKNFKIIESSLINKSYGQILIWKLEEDLEFNQFKVLLDHYKSLYPSLIISGKTSKLGSYLKSNKIKILKKETFKNYTAILI